jgi:hypothetical protein
LGAAAWHGKKRWMLRSWLVHVGPATTIRSHTWRFLNTNSFLGALMYGILLRSVIQGMVAVTLCNSMCGVMLRFII